MKKFFKFVGSVTLLCAAVAGGVFAYKKFFAPDPFDDDFDVPEDSADTDDAVAGRGYVSLTSEESEEEETLDSEKAEEVSGEEAAETEI